MKKTLRSRIAAVAVAALGAGLLQAAPAFAADDTGFTISGATNYLANGKFAPGTLATGQVGVCVVPFMLDTGGDVVTQNGKSTTTTGYPAPLADGDTLTGAMRTDGTFVLDGSTGTATADVRLVVTGGTISGYTAGATTDTMNSSRTSLIMEQTSDAFPTVKFSPTGAGVMQITLLKGTYSAPNFTATSTIAIWNLSVSATCGNGALSASKSTVALVLASGGSKTTFPSVDDPKANITDNLAPIYVEVALKDVYGFPLTSGLLTATVGTGAQATWDSTEPSGSAFIAVSNASGHYTLTITQTTPNVPVTTPVTIQYNGVTIGQKSVTIRGVLAKLVVDDVVVGLAGKSSGASSNEGSNTAENPVLAGLYLSDSAGNSLSTSGRTFVFSGLGAQIPSASVWGFSSTYRYGKILWSCGTVGSGSAKLTVSTVSETGATITSNEFTAACARGVYNYTATLDKKEYAPGDVATLTISATDSKGNPVYDATALSAGNPDGVAYLGTYYYDEASEGDFDAVLAADGTLTATLFKSSNAPVIIGGPMTPVVAAKANDYFSEGKIKYTFTVGTGQAGNFNLVVNLPAYNVPGVQSAVTVAYTVKAGAADPTVKALTDAIASMMTSIQLLMTSLSASISTLIKALAKKK